MLNKWLIIMDIMRFTSLSYGQSSGLEQQTRNALGAGIKLGQHTRNTLCSGIKEQACKALEISKKLGQQSHNTLSPGIKERACKALETGIKLSATISQTAFYLGRHVTSLTLGAVIGFLHWLGDSSPTERNLADRQINASPLTGIPYLEKVVSNLRACRKSVIDGAYQRDYLSNRAPDNPTEATIRGTEETSNIPDQYLLVFGKIPEIVGGVILTYLTTIVYAAPLLYFLPAPLLIALILNTPYLLDAEPFGGHENFIHKLLRKE